METGDPLSMHRVVHHTVFIARFVCIHQMGNAVLTKTNKQYIILFIRFPGKRPSV